MREILCSAEKPFQGIKNTDVIHLIENKQRLSKPALTSQMPTLRASIALKAMAYRSFTKLEAE
jgi:hypothetical protein